MFLNIKKLINIKEDFFSGGQVMKGMPFRKCGCLEVFLIRFHLPVTKILRVGSHVYGKIIIVPRVLLYLKCFSVGLLVSLY